MKYKKIFYVFIFLIFLISINFYVVTHLSKTNNYFVHKVKSLIPQSSRDFLKKFNNIMTKPFINTQEYPINLRSHEFFNEWIYQK